MPCSVSIFCMLAACLVLIGILISIGYGNRQSNTLLTGRLWWTSYIIEGIVSLRGVGHLFQEEESHVSSRLFSILLLGRGGSRFEVGAVEDNCREKSITRTDCVIGGSGKFVLLSQFVQFALEARTRGGAVYLHLLLLCGRFRRVTWRLLSFQCALFFRC